MTLEEVKRYYNSFDCERLTSCPQNKDEIQEFSCQMRKNTLETYLKTQAWEDDADGETCVYVIRDHMTRNIVFYFSLKCGGLFTTYELDNRYNGLDEPCKLFVNSLVKARMEKENDKYYQLVDMGKSVFGEKQIGIMQGIAEHRTTRSRMKAGTQKICTTSLLGYDTDEDDKMVIVTNEAEVVRTIYRSFEKGMHPTEIAEKLNALEIRTIKNNPWSREAVKNILRNEKYCGDFLMQKTYTVDCLTHKTKKNEGEVEQYFISDHHPAIIDRGLWEKAQIRLDQIAGRRRRIRPKQQRLIPLRKGVLLGFVPIKQSWKNVSFKRLETATEKVMELVGTVPSQERTEKYESEVSEVAILEGFEVINLKQPKGESVMTVTSSSLKFNKATAVELNYAPYRCCWLHWRVR